MATLLLPVSLTLLHVLLVERAGIVFGLPLAAVTEVIVVADDLSLGGRRSVEVRGEALALADLVGVLGGTGPPLPMRPPAVVLAIGARRVAILCDRVLGDQEILTKPLGPLLADSVPYLGTAILTDGSVALIPDPARIVTAANEAGHPDARRQDELSAPKVLVVDDQFTVRELQRSILEAAGYRVRTARDGREAWELLSAGDDAELVVTDVEMPGMDGLELLRAIRAAPERASLPVVVVTSRGAEEDERSGLEAGADAYIVKQRFDQRALLDTVHRLIGR